MELTSRQREIVNTLAKTGGSNKAIAKELGITPSTVKAHLYEIQARLGASNRTQVALWAR